MPNRALTDTALEERVHSRMREVFGWSDERIAHYLDDLQEQTGWSRELVLLDAAHACDEGPLALEPWRADAYLGPVPGDPELAEINTIVARSCARFHGATRRSRAGSGTSSASTAGVASKHSGRPRRWLSR